MIRKLLLAGAIAGYLLPLQAATFLVSSTSDDGPGSLRQAISDANATTELDVIAFNIGAGGQQAIVLSSALPDVVFPLEIDGTTQPGFAGSPLVEINGNQREAAILLKVSSGGTTIRSLLFSNVGRNSPGDCLVFSGGGGNKVEGCWFGVDLSGAARKRIRGYAVLLENSADNIIGGGTLAARNVISGSSTGVGIIGAESQRNQVLGNFIGLNAAGEADISNNTGVLILNAPGNTVGGPRSSSANYLTGSSQQQLRIEGAAATGNRVVGNYVGLKINGSGLTASPGNANGIRIEGAPGNRIGTPSADEGNIIGNNATGIVIIGEGAANNVVQGNRIGTDTAGLAAIANHNGISVGQGSTGTVIGGTEPGQGNLISGNRTDGLRIQDSSNNLVQGNYIGTDVTGNQALPNTTAGASGSGIVINSLAVETRGNQVGGLTAAARNVVSITMRV